MPVAGGIFAGFMFFYVFSLLVIEKDLARSDGSSFNPFLEAIAVLLEPRWFFSAITGVVACYLFGAWFFGWIVVSSTGQKPARPQLREDVRASAPFASVSCLKAKSGI
jgi:hypothetical protein